LLSELSVADLRVKDAPIEQIVGRLFREGKVPGSQRLPMEEETV
jgi:hypothetical protein